MLVTGEQSVDDSPPLRISRLGRDATVAPLSLPTLEPQRVGRSEVMGSMQRTEELVVRAGYSACGTELS